MPDNNKISTRYDRLPNLEAIAQFNGKALITNQEYSDFRAYEHALAFTVAKIADQDMLAEIHKAVKQAIENGTTFQDFQKRLKPYLMAKGWLDLPNTRDGKAELGHRLKVIYHTNKQTAYAGGRWERIQKTKDFLPYLQYMPSVSVNKRDEHKHFYGIIRPVDDEIWQFINPPNGFGCKCWIKQLSKSQADRLGVTSDDDIKALDWNKHTDPSTGQQETVLKGVTLGFNHNHDRLTAMLELAEDKHGKNFVYALKQQAIKRFPKAIPISLLDYKEMAEIGKTIFEKYELDKVDFNKPHEFSHTLIQALKKEGVEFGGVADVVGDETKTVIDILKRYPKSWVQEANAMGKTYIRNTNERGLQAFMYSEKHLKKAIELTKIDESYFAFSGFIKDTKVGDSWIKLNDLTSRSGGYNVTIHEFAHRLQLVMPKLNDYFKSLWLTRTQGEKTRPLANIQIERGEIPTYHIKEVGKKDHFVNVYIGRNYGTDDNPLPMEVMTMTFEVLLGDNMVKKRPNQSEILRYWQNDPEMIYLGIGLLLRFEP